MSGRLLIDAHQHFWDLDRVEYPWLTPEAGILHRTYLPGDLAPELAAAGVDATIVVQAADSREETAFLLELATATDWVQAVVGWVPLLDPAACSAALDRWCEVPAFRGIRHLVHDEADPDWLVRPTVLESLRMVAERDLVFEIPAEFPRHLGHVPALAEAAPDLAIVIDHLGKPPVASGEVRPWATAFRAACAPPQVRAKLSGLGTEARPGRWSRADLAPYVDVALDALGPDRLLFGSDWPVLLANGDYATTVAETLATVDRLAPGERDAIRGGTASALYRLGGPTGGGPT